MTRVWVVPLSTPLTAGRLGCLSAEERARAARFHRPLLAQHWSVAHVALREALAAVTGAAAAEVDIRVGVNGKPYLPDGPAFNLSHAGEYALVAVGGGDRVGVDIELQRPIPELADIAHSHFAPEERNELLALPSARQTRAFYRIWTRKEAFVKASGIGVGPALQRFAVSIGEEARIRRVDADIRIHAPRLLDLPVPAGYAAALVVEGGDGEVDLRRWNATAD